MEKIQKVVRMFNSFEIALGHFFISFSFVKEFFNKVVSFDLDTIPSPFHLNSMKVMEFFNIMDCLNLVK